MKTLSDILYKVSIVSVQGNVLQTVNEIVFDSRKALSQKVFVAVKGTQTNGHQFIQTCINQGCTAVVCEVLPEQLVDEVTYVVVKDSSVALGQMASNFFDSPSEKLKVVAVTGTNGKTTIATLLYRMFQLLGYKCGLLSTVENKIANEIIASTHTTPDVVAINELMHRMVAAGCSYCFMEASSHAIDQNRMAGIQLAGAVFTNLTHDHLDYHKTFNNYLNAKKKLFDGLSSHAFALSNADDKHGLTMLQHSNAVCFTYSIQKPASYSARVLEDSFVGLHLKLDAEDVYAKLIGNFNASNLLAVYSVARILGVEKLDALTAVSQLEAAEGRFDYFRSEKESVIGIVDYAHTPDALIKVLDTIKEIRTGNETLITIIGCGGNRDAAKRPVMAAAAADRSDRVILTSDNPRNENAAEILIQMQQGVSPAKTKKVITIQDRKEAINAAVSMAKGGDIILLAGKGHEKYQEINGVKYPFDDKQILIQSFKNLDK